MEPRDYLPEPTTMGLAEEMAELNKDNPEYDAATFDELVEEPDFIDFEEG